jgi:hypothetical protein
MPNRAASTAGQLQPAVALPARDPRELLHEVRPKVQVSRPASMGASRVMGHASIEAPPVKLGALVTHPKFGEGMVTDYEGSGAHARAGRVRRRRQQVAGDGLRQPDGDLIAVEGADPPAGGL